MVEIIQVEDGSPAALAGLAAGDRVHRINGFEIKDFIDFYYQAAETLLELETSRRGIFLTRVLEREPGVGLGLRIADRQIRRCGNRCIFCFVDQLPRGLRPSLYLKDEDYRQSFLRGNFITGSTLSRANVERIIDLGLSPLYISVHATDPVVRAAMLGGCRKPEILPLLTRLLDGGVKLHYQAVICPGINDGQVLEKTMDELEALGPGGISLALVPVGLTAHREGLAALEPINRAKAREVLRLVRNRQRRYLAGRGLRFVFAADEFYLLAGSRFPSSAAYEGYPQIENGVGLVRQSLVSFRAALGKLERRGLAVGRIGMVSGTHYSRVLRERVLPELRKRFGDRFVLAEAVNTLLGESVTVAGLLPGRDILSAARKAGVADTWLVPAEALNSDGLFLDDMSLEEIKRELAPARVTASAGIGEALESLSA